MGKGERHCTCKRNQEGIIQPKLVIRLQYVHSYDSMVLFPNIFFLSTFCLSL